MPLADKYSKAEKTASMARIVLYGVDGSGKTYTALALARALAPDGDILVLDTEQVGEAAPRSAQYDQFGHYVDALPLSEMLGISPQYPEGSQAVQRTAYDTLKSRISEALTSGAEVVIIDSWTDENTVYLAQAVATGDNRSYYMNTKPKRTLLLEAIKNAPCHVILCQRSKEQGVWSDGGEKQKSKIIRMALQPDGNGDIGYATNIRIAMEDGVARIVKSVYETLPQDATYNLAGGDETFYELVASSLDEGRKTKALFKFELGKRGISGNRMKQIWEELPDLGQWTEETHDDMLATIDAHLEQPVAETA